MTEAVLNEVPSLWKKIVLRGLKKETIFFYLSLGFQNRTSSLTELDTNFPTKGWSSYTLAPGESSFGCCESIFWLSVQAWSPVISRPRWKIFRKKHELSTTLELRNHLRGKKFQHLEKPLGSDRKCSIQLEYSWLSKDDFHIFTVIFMVSTIFSILNENVVPTKVVNGIRESQTGPRKKRKRSDDQAFCKIDEPKVSAAKAQGMAYSLTMENVLFLLLCQSFFF